MTYEDYVATLGDSIITEERYNYLLANGFQPLEIAHREGAYLALQDLVGHEVTVEEVGEELPWLIAKNDHSNEVVTELPHPQERMEW